MNPRRVNRWTGWNCDKCGEQSEWMVWEPDPKPHSQHMRVTAGAIYCSDCLPPNVQVAAYDPGKHAVID